MTTRSRGIAAMAVTLLVLIALTACGGDEADDQATATATAETTEQTTDEAGTAAPVEATEQTTDEAGTAAPVEPTEAASTPAPSGSPVASPAVPGASPAASLGASPVASPVASPAAPQADIAELWNSAIPDDYRVDAVVIAGDRLLILTTSDEFGTNLIVHDLHDGAFLWSHAEPESGARMTALDDRVFVTRGAAVVALDLASGDVLWQRDGLADDIGQVLAGAGTLFLLTDGALLALDASDGSDRWQRAGSLGRIWLAGGALVGTSTPPDADPTIWIRYSGISLETGNEVWRRESPQTTFTAVNPDSDRLAVTLATDDASTVVLLEATTGAMVELPESACPGASAITTDAVVCGPDVVDLATGNVYPLDVAGVQDPWSGHTSGARYLVIDEARLVALDLATGGRLWSHDVSPLAGPTETATPSRPAMSASDDTVVVPVTMRADEGSGTSRYVIVVLGDPDAVTPSATPSATPPS